MQGLKVLVVVMGFAIFAILGVIIFTVAGRISEPDEAEAGFGEVLLTLPEDCVFAGAEPAGDERLALILEGEAGCSMIVVFDLERGEEVGRIVLDAP
ncbi:MAG: hypothetical protein QNJ67_08190 [Kiloniellales bacterium]|nr:hypothetical protein [Kiloniellales bacterium]